MRLIEDIQYYAFSLLQYDVLVDVCGENPALHKLSGWKKEEYFSNLFSDNYEYSSLTLHQNLTSGSFLKIWCSVEFEILWMNFLCS